MEPSDTLHAQVVFSDLFQVFKFQKVSMSQVQVNRKELQKAGYRVLQEMRVDVKPL